MTVTRLFFCTDIHGSEKCFRKFVNAGKFYNATVLVLGGDITGKMVIPIIARGNGTYSCNFLGNEMHLRTSQELDNTAKNIRDAGYYPYMTSPNEVDHLLHDKAKTDAVFEKLMKESIGKWVQLATQRLSGSETRCYISPGNDDTFAIDKELTDTGTVVNPEKRVVKIDDKHEMITLGVSNHTPWNSPREVDEEQLQQMLDQLCSNVEDMRNCLFNTHVPPIDTTLDKAPALDATFKPLIKHGQVEYTSAGSSAVRKTIEKHQPLAGIHGHIHESKGVAKIGETSCFNPGSEYTEGILKGLLLDLDDARIKNYMFTTG